MSLIVLFRLFRILGFGIIVVCSVAPLRGMNNNSRVSLAPTIIFQQDNLISFYEIPFSCSVKDGLGCGSAAKPVLLKMAANNGVAEAWMNRKGSVIAVIWKPGISELVKTAIIKDAFQIFGFAPDELTDNEMSEFLKSFQSRTEWYREADVDLLSLEEASENAKLLMGILEKHKWIDPTAKTYEPLYNEIESYYKRELVITRTEDPLKRWASELKEIIKKHISNDEVNKLIIYRVNDQE